MRLYRQPAIPTDKVPQHLAERYENEAGKYWEAFYKRNADKFFKDRHYFDKEFPELLQGRLSVLEVGCGVGNSVFPLLEINDQLQVYACDFSSTAVELVKAHPAYAASDRVTAFVADITQDQLSQHVPSHRVDYCSMVFVLSAVAPDRMPQAVRNVAQVLKSGTGRVLFRDYAQGDLAQTRLEDSSGAKFIRENFYVRGDGTCCYYYTEDGLKALFAAEGFLCESTIVHARVIENRKSGVKMPRRWIQAVFRYAPDEVDDEQRTAAKQEWETQQQQQQQQQQPAGRLQECQQQQLGSCSTSSLQYTCAGKQWQLPARLNDSNSSWSYLQHLRSNLDGLLQEQQLQLLGRCLLLLPPWLTLQHQHEQQHCLQLQQLTAAPTASRASCGCCCCCNDGSNSSSEPHSRDVQYIQGAAAALLALIAVWRGARRVYACMAGKDLEKSTRNDSPGAYETGFMDVLQLNECDVVIERVQLRRWEAADNRQLQLLHKDLLGQKHNINLLVGWAAASGRGGKSCVACAPRKSQITGVQLQEDVQRFLEGLFERSRGHQHAAQQQLLLLGHS